MADSAAYGMGQIRFSSTTLNNHNYMKELNFTVEGYKNTGLTSESFYREILITPSDSSFTFSAGTPYYLTIGIPKNTTYDMELDVQLVYKDSADSTEVNIDEYQEIKRIIVPRISGSDSGISRVLIFPYPNHITGNDWSGSNVVSAIAKTDLNAGISPGEVYYAESSGIYYYNITNEIQTSTANMVTIDNKNDILLTHTWEYSVSTELAYFDFVFTPQVDVDFSHILFTMVRKGYDSDIQFEIDGEIYNGLHIDEDDVVFSLYEVVNMVNNSTFYTNAVSAFTSIGVWSHPNALMAINGEEIRIGQSGYYELNNFEITSFGMIVQDVNDRFTVDYQYQLST